MMSFVFSYSLVLLGHSTYKQCDQMLNIWPFSTVKICPTAYFFGKVTKFRQILVTQPTTYQILFHLVNSLTLSLKEQHFRFYFALAVFNT